ncbi:MAG: hypothetical protein IKN41_04485, partial [Candidatus Methanomethylophilaceae archaeon]|nr:hypothetical protein [Candidatus Methanomethylophilaceae archaeon]
MTGTAKISTDEGTSPLSGTFGHPLQRLIYKDGRCIFREVFGMYRAITMRVEPRSDQRRFLDESIR